MVDTGFIPDSVLLEKIRNGNRDAYALLYRQYYTPLLRKAVCVLRDEMEAEDTVQTFFTELWQNKLLSNVHTSIAAYLHAAIYHRCLNVLEKKKKVQLRFLEYAASVADHEFNNAQGDDSLVRHLLGQLSMRRSQAVTLVCVEEKKYREAAIEMGISVNSLKTHLKLAIRVLRKNIFS